MQKLLIANRGEIASRIIRTCKRLGISTVALYSEADREMPYVRQADESFLIGPPPVAQSYLNVDKILEIARETGADAIHPGYGLLSENAAFARRAEQEGITFVGPSSDVIEKMGDKMTARKTMDAAGVPIVPGMDIHSDDVEEAIRAANEIGFPVMLKASSGGGGVGMILCEDEQALTQHFASTKKRAKAYFGSDEMFLEKYIANARHIEVQIMADYEGAVYHLFERNCSMQRRNQKVVEESPSPMISSRTRESLYRIAVRAAEAVGYRNAGTIELIVDEQEGIYFLEMNTRLQVEHPVTEEVTGVDLVEWQLLTAMNQPLPVRSQEEIHSSGHSIELRLYAEDPKTFYPSPGKIERLSFPDLPGVRLDFGYEEGNQVTPFYDPMIGKLIVTGSSRSSAIARLIETVGKSEISGLKTNLPFLLELIQTDEFNQGNYHTGTIQSFSKGEMKK